MIDPAVFTRIFKNKVIMYLFDDAAKQKRITLFGGCDEKAKTSIPRFAENLTPRVFTFSAKESVASLLIMSQRMMENDFSILREQNAIPRKTWLKSFIAPRKRLSAF